MNQPKPLTLLTVAGTRPEVLKLAPLIRQLRSPARMITAKTCFSGQHREILENILGDLDVEPDVDLRAPGVARSLSQAFAWLLERLEAAIGDTQPAGVIVQGDTNTALAGALAAFHHKVPCFHVEAGLRTRDNYSPFPEEMNRRLISRMAALHFAPTELAREHLLAEGIDPSTILVTGNTGVDALHIYAGQHSPEAAAVLARLTRPNVRPVLVTLHRRENADSVTDATDAVRRLVMTYPDVEVLWILHVNQIRERVQAELHDVPGVHLIEPQSYRTFVHLMKAAHIILTDSGGVQEEAPVLGRPVLVLREETERPEAVAAGCSRVVGCDTREILRHCRQLLEDEAQYAAMSRPQSPFGDGHASERIAAALEGFYASAQGQVNTQGGGCR